MKKGKCIYCKATKDLNEEHAFPNILRPKDVRAWIIDEHVCVKCNSTLGELDEALGKRSALALIWNRIQNELGNEDQTLHSSIYRKPANKVKPLRLFAPDPVYDNYIVLHEIATLSSNTSAPMESAPALCPQMILVQYPEGQTVEKIIAENCEKFNATSSDEDIITDYDGQQEVYCVLGNTYIFPPKATEHFFQNASEFKSKFVTDFPRTRYDLLCLFPEQDRSQGAAEAFYNSLVGEMKEIRDAEKIPDPKPVIQVMYIRTDPKAMSKIARAIAKLAFHCFLYHYREFSGHEPIFDDIREFIYTGSPNRFVNEWKISEGENLIYGSTEPLHCFCFFLQDDDTNCQIDFIGCRIDFFTGLKNPPFSYQVILAGDPADSTPSPSRTEDIPFYVHQESQMKMQRQIVPVERLATIWTPSSSTIWVPISYKEGLWLP